MEFISGSSRDEALQRLVFAFDAVSQSNETHVVDLVGSPGVGKTRLVQQLYRVIAASQDVWPKSLLVKGFTRSAGEGVVESHSTARKRISIVDHLRHGTPIGAGKAPWLWSAVTCRIDERGAVTSDVVRLEREIYSLAPYLGLSSNSSDLIRRLVGPVSAAAAQDAVGMVVPIPGLGAVTSLLSAVADEIGTRTDTAADAVVNPDAEAGRGLLSAVELLSINRPEMPLVFVVEDAHYGDSLLFEFLDSLAARGSKPLARRRAGFLILLTSWAESRTSLDEFKASLDGTADTNVIRIDLGSFDPSDLVSMVKLRAPATTDATALLLATNVQGNPHLLVLHMDLLDDEWGPYAGMSTGDGRTRAYITTPEVARQLPETPREAILSLWGVLDPKIKFVLAVAAQQGPEFAPDLVASVAAAIGPASLGQADSADALAAAEERDMWIREMSQRIKWFYEPDRHWVAESDLDPARVLAVAEETEKWLRAWRQSHDWESEQSERRALLLSVHVQSAVALMSSSRGENLDFALALESGMELIKGRFLANQQDRLGRFIEHVRALARSIDDWSALVRIAKFEFEQGRDIDEVKRGAEELSVLAQCEAVPLLLRLEAATALSDGTTADQTRGFEIVETVATSAQSLDERIVACSHLTRWAVGGRQRAGELCAQLLTGTQWKSLSTSPVAGRPEMNAPLAIAIAVAAISPAPEHRSIGQDRLATGFSRLSARDRIFILETTSQSADFPYLPFLIDAALALLDDHGLSADQRSRVHLALAKCIARLGVEAETQTSRHHGATKRLSADALAHLGNCSRELASASAKNNWASSIHEAGLKSAMSLTVADGAVRAAALERLDAPELKRGLTFHGQLELATTRAMLDPSAGTVRSAFGPPMADESVPLITRVRGIVGRHVFLVTQHNGSYFGPPPARALNQLCVELILRYVDELGYSDTADVEGQWLFMLALEWERDPSSVLGEGARSSMLEIGRTSLPLIDPSSSPASWTRCLNVASAFRRVRQSASDEDILFEACKRMYSALEPGGGYEADFHLPWLVSVMADAGACGKRMAIEVCGSQIRETLDLRRKPVSRDLMFCNVLVDNHAIEHLDLVVTLCNRYIEVHDPQRGAAARRILADVDACRSRSGENH